MITLHNLERNVIGYKVFLLIPLTPLIRKLMFTFSSAVFMAQNLIFQNSGTNLSVTVLYF